MKKRLPTPAGLGAGNTATIAAAPAASSPAEAPAAETPTPVADTTASAEQAPSDEAPAHAPADEQPAPAETSEVPPPVDEPASDEPDPLAMYDARVLVSFDEHEPNDIVSGTIDELGLLERDGKVDPHPDAVAYVRSLQA